MSDHLALVLSSCVCSAIALVLLGVAISLGRQTKALRNTVHRLVHELLPLARDARRAADQAATELDRVGEVLGSAEAVSATVDSASRLAYRAFSNPVVKIMAYGTGFGGAMRRMFGRPPAVARSAGAVLGSGTPRPGIARSARTTSRSLPSQTEQPEANDR